MNFEEVKNSVNQWIWDNDLRIHLWILATDNETKIIRAKGKSGLETQTFFALNRFFKDEKSAFILDSCS